LPKVHVNKQQSTSHIMGALRYLVITAILTFPTHATFDEDSEEEDYFVDEHEDFEEEGCPGRKRFCRCDLSKPSTFHHDDATEWCFMLHDPDCVLGTGQVAAELPKMGANTIAPCWKISGRGLFWQRQLQEPDVLKRCSPPDTTACVQSRPELLPNVFSALDTGSVSSELSISMGLANLGAALQRLGFNHSAVMLVGQFEADAQVYPQLDKQGLPAINSAIADMVRFFVVGSPIPRDVFETLLPPQARSALVALNAVVMWGHTIWALVQLFPVEGGFFFTDLPGTDGIMFVGVDSLGLAGTSTVATAGLSGKVSILDACTGSGVQGITAARHAILKGFDVDLTLLDINPRAKRFATANLFLNEVHGRFVQSDMVAGVRFATFDIILANTPFVPSSEIARGTWAYFTDGGTDGERVTARVVQEGLPLLKRTGRMIIATPIYNPDTIFQRLVSWGLDPQDAGAFIVHSDIQPYTKPGHVIKTVAREGIIAISRCTAGTKTEVVMRAWTAIEGCGVGPKWNNWMNCFHEKSHELRSRVLGKIAEFIGNKCKLTASASNDEL